MDVILFVSGEKSFIANSNSKWISIPSIALFHDPALFKGRLLYILKAKMNLNSLEDVEKFIVVIPGVVNPKTNEIIHSKVLNNLSNDRNYDNTNLNDLFSGVISIEKIYLTSDIQFISTGIAKTHFKNNSYSLVVSLGENLGFAIINKSGKIYPLNINKDKVPQLNLSIEEAIGGYSVVEILRNKIININDEFSYSLLMCILQIINSYTNYNIEAIYLLGERVEFVDLEFLENKLKGKSIKIINSEDELKKIIFNGIGKLTLEDYVKEVFDLNTGKSLGIVGASLALGTLFSVFNPLTPGLATVIGVSKLYNVMKNRKKKNNQENEPNRNSTSQEISLYVEVKSDNPVTEILYLVNGKTVSTFNTFEEWKEHFISAKPIVNPDNKYVIKYQNNDYISVSIGNITDEFELQQYMF